jgi:riboflavin synthase
LERAVGADVRFGGHFVQVMSCSFFRPFAINKVYSKGHIDDTATLISISPDDNSVRLLLQLPPPTPTRPSLLPSIIPKGFIALDGASLTITSVNDEERTFGVMLIAHTQTRITLGTKKVGSKVNVEVDMVGKYVEKAVVAALGGEEGGGGLRGLIEKVVEETLRKKGLV